MNNELRFHPLADIFPLMEGEEFDALVADIKASGLQQPIVTYEGMILDGRNRYRACLAAGVQPEFDDIDAFICIAPAAYVVSANIHRRHLKPEKKRELIVKCADWTKSDRTIGEQFKCDHKTIAKARKQAKATGEASPVEKRIGKDGKARKQPKRKGWLTENERKWRDLWVAEGRSMADYRAGINDPTSAVWKWRRVKGREGIERERQAWLADHPDQTADDYDRVTTCAASDEDEAAYLELRGRKAERRETLAIEVERLASKLIELDRDTARRLYDLLGTDDGHVRLMCALAHRLYGDGSASS